MVATGFLLLALLITLGATHGLTACHPAMCMVLRMRQQRRKGPGLHHECLQLQMAAFLLSHAQHLPGAASCSPASEAGSLSTRQESLV